MLPKGGSLVALPHAPPLKKTQAAQPPGNLILRRVTQGLMAFGVELFECQLCKDTILESL